jgi:DNA-binding CsgD family transcriptional regulator
VEPVAEDSRIHRIISQIYDAAGNPDQWAACLASICDLLHGSAAHLLYHDAEAHESGIRASTLDPIAARLYSEHFHRVDPWAQRLTPGIARSGTIALGQSLVSHHEMVKTEFYADYGRTADTTRTLIAFLDTSGARSTGLTINRSDRGHEFDATHARLIGILLPHVRRALTFHRRLMSIDARRAAAADVIDGLSIAVILVDARLRPVLVNRAAERLLAARDGLVIDRSGLRASTAALTAALRTILVNATGITDGSVSETGAHALAMPRPSGRRPLQITVTPVARSNEYVDHPGRAKAALFITDPDRTAAGNNEALRQTYGLTATEARVACAVADGLRVAQIADLVHLTGNTVRWYIKQALAKTGTSTQAQLVRVVLCTPPTVEP